MDGRPLPDREPLGVLDEAILHLDSPSEPWSIHVELWFQGRLDETRLRESLATALKHHPAARATLATVSTGRHRYEWRTAPLPDVDPLDVVHGDGDRSLVAAREELQSRPIPLEASPPLRMRLHRHRGRDVLMLNLHHAAGDGMAALALLQSIARAYSGRPEIVPTLPRGPVARPLSRDQLRAVAAELGEAARPSARIAPDGGRERPGYAFHLLRLDTARTQALRDRRREGVTVNDLLMAALHLSVARWNADHGRPARRVSVLMPVNLRSRRRGGEGFGNFTFMVPVSTLARDRASASTAVDAISRRTRTIKEQHTPAAVVNFLQRLRSLPPGARRAIARQVGCESLMPTALLSNLGVMEHDLDFGPGAGHPVHAWFSPPAMMPLGLAIGAVTVGEQLHITLRARHPLMGPDALARFAASYEGALDALLNVDAPVRQRPSSYRRAA